MNILLISNMYPSVKAPSYGIFVKNFYEYFKNNSQNSQIKKVTINGPRRSILSKTIAYCFFIVRALYNIIAKKYDIIYVHFAYHSLFPFLFLPKWSHLYNKLIINAHGSDIFNLNQNSLITKRIVQTILNAKMVVVPSSYLKEQITKIGFPKEKVYISPSAGINTKVFFPTKQKPEHFTIGYISRITKEKGITTFIESLKTLDLNNKKVNVIIAGKGNLSLFLSNNDVKNLSDRNIYIKFKGEQTQPELRKIFNSIDIMVFPSYSESLGLVGIEAMACGKPVIGSNIPGIKSYLKDNLNGFLFKVKDSSDLARKIEKYYYLDKVLKAELEHNAVETSKEFSTVRIMKALEKKIAKIK